MNKFYSSTSNRDSIVRLFTCNDAEVLIQAFEFSSSILLYSSLPSSFLNYSPICLFCLVFSTLVFATLVFSSLIFSSFLFSTLLATSFFFLPFGWSWNQSLLFLSNIIQSVLHHHPSSSRWVTLQKFVDLSYSILICSDYLAYLDI